MKNKFLTIVAAFSAVTLLAACGQALSTPTATPLPPPATPAAGPPTKVPPQVAMGRPFTLKLGDYVEVAGAQMLLTFSRVTQDSRCPIDVVCIRAGDATIDLRVSTARVESQTVSLTIGGNASATFDGYRITAQELAPAPRAGTPTPQGAYVVTLLVEVAG